jgi:hypothetical protein
MTHLSSNRCLRIQRQIKTLTARELELAWHRLAGHAQVFVDYPGPISAENLLETIELSLSLTPGEPKS